jgi:hypothetical protein
MKGADSAKTIKANLHGSDAGGGSSPPEPETAQAWEWPPPGRDGQHHHRGSYRKSRCYATVSIHISIAETASSSAYAEMYSIDAVSQQVSKLINSQERLTLGAKYPGDTPARQAEALGEPINDEHVILVDILHVLGGGNGSAVAVARVVVARVELVADEGGAATADVLDLGQLRIRDDPAGRVARVRGQDDGSTAGNLLGDLVGVDVVAILLGQRHGNGSKLFSHKS